MLAPSRTSRSKMFVVELVLGNKKAIAEELAGEFFWEVANALHLQNINS